MGGAIILGERMNERAIAGCVLMLAGIIIAQIDFARIIKRKTK